MMLDFPGDSESYNQYPQYNYAYNGTTLKFLSLNVMKKMNQHVDEDTRHLNKLTGSVYNTAIRTGTAPASMIWPQDSKASMNAPSISDELSVAGSGAKSNKFLTKANSKRKFDFL